MEGKNVLKNQKYFVDAWLVVSYFVGWLRKVKWQKQYTLQLVPQKH